METTFLAIGDGRKLAYQKYEASSPSSYPTIVFLCGHGSDMFGSKAQALASHCVAEGYGFVRFDYSGHGLSSGEFLDGTVSAWTDDAITILDELTSGPVILVGSSLGGWIMLNVARQKGAKIAGLIGIAAAPDFTQRLIWDELSQAQQEKMVEEGHIALPNPYADEDVIYPYHLITDGRDNLLLDKPLDITCPIRLLQGMADHEVPWQTASDIALAVLSDDVQITLRKDSGHRFSSDEELALIIDALEDMMKTCAVS